MFITPFAMNEMCSFGKPKGLNTSSLKQLFTGGSPISKNVLLEMQKLLPGTHVTQAYGQTEAGGLVFGFDPENLDDLRLQHLKPESCGRPVEGVMLKVISYLFYLLFS